MGLDVRHLNFETHGGSTRSAVVVDSSGQPGAVISAGTTLSGRSLRDFPSVMDYGPNVGRGYRAPVYPLIAGGTAALGDNLGHTLADVYANLSAAQVDYPAATSLSPTVDSAAVQLAGDTVIASQANDLTWPAPAAGWNINTPITWVPANGGSGFSLNINGRQMNPGGTGSRTQILWTGGNSASVIRTLGLRNCHWHGLWVQLAANVSSVTALDFDGDGTRTFAGFVGLYDTDVRWSNATACIGVRTCHNPSGGMTGGGGYTFTNVRSTGSGTGTQPVGFSIEYNNNLSNLWINCTAGGPGCKGWTNAPSAGAGGAPKGSRDWTLIGCAGSNADDTTAIDIELQEGSSLYPAVLTVIGGRWERGGIFLNLKTDGSSPANNIDVTIIGTSIENYQQTSTVFNVTTPASIELIGVKMPQSRNGGSAGTGYGTGMITLGALPGGTLGKFKVRRGSFHTSGTTFWTAGTGWTVEVEDAKQLGGALGLSEAGPLATVRYTAFTVTGTYVVPFGVTKARARATGAGGPGAGGGSASTGIAQAGGGGGAAGPQNEAMLTVTPGESLTVNVQTAPAGGAGGAAGGNPGVAGTQSGGSTNLQRGGTNLVAARGGTPGALSAASSTTAVGGGVYGTGATVDTSAAKFPGSGGASASQTATPWLAAVGGSGGGAANATNGGGAGTAQQSGVFLDIQFPPGGGASGTAAGVNGVAATQPGCGGGGGGGGTNNTGAGGNGGAGATGQLEIWW